MVDIVYAMVLYHSMTEAATLAAFPFQLGENVLQWYLNSDDSVRTSLNNLKQAFLKRFSPDKTLFDTNVLCIKQIPGENVDDYVARVIKQTAECDILAKMIVGIAIQGLRGPLAKIVMPQKPKSMEELREMTLLAEKTIKCTESPDESLTATIVGMQAEIANLSEKLNVASLAAISTINRGDSGTLQRQNNFQSQPRNANPNFVCFRCNRRNCDLSRCPAKNKICYNCNKIGHFDSACRLGRRSNRGQQNMNSRNQNNAYRRNQNHYPQEHQAYPIQQQSYPAISYDPNYQNPHNSR
ncbi:unnamed protein product [Mytilus coruscus]|uniref:CCHC-type domain-containing protein n=1 Tax=Mytilus coruscus TaxID=42192 RepID=A0A6J8AFS6_MYTCO|nr:unnamed protein product [Mytilus coruscus]